MFSARIEGTQDRMSKVYAVAVFEFRRANGASVYGTRSFSWPLSTLFFLLLRSKSPLLQAFLHFNTFRVTPCDEPRLSRGKVQFGEQRPGSETPAVEVIPPTEFITRLRSPCQSASLLESSC